MLNITKIMDFFFSSHVHIVFRTREKGELLNHSSLNVTLCALDIFCSRVYSIPSKFI